MIFPITSARAHTLSAAVPRNKSANPPFDA